MILKVCSPVRHQPVSSICFLTEASSEDLRCSAVVGVKLQLDVAEVLGQTLQVCIMNGTEEVWVSLDQEDKRDEDEQTIYLR